jgi:hypothetical protein
MARNVDALVMGTVNAPWKCRITAEQLAAAVHTGEVEPHICHLSSSYGEVAPDLVLEFAASHAITAETLSARYREVQKLSGTSNRRLEPFPVGVE